MFRIKISVNTEAGLYESVSGPKEGGSRKEGGGGVGEVAGGKKVCPSSV